MAIEQAMDECKTGGPDTSKNRQIRRVHRSSSLESYLRDEIHKARQAAIKDAHQSRIKIWSMIDAGKTTQPDAMDTLDLVEGPSKEMMRTTQPD